MSHNTIVELANVISTQTLDIANLMKENSTLRAELEQAKAEYAKVTTAKECSKPAKENKTK